MEWQNHRSNAARLHRRAVVGSALLLAGLIMPFLVVLAWINWSIVFRGAEWAQFNTLEFGLPELLAAFVGAVAIIISIRTLARWAFGRVEARLRWRNLAANDQH